MVLEASPDIIAAYSEGEEGIYGAGGTIAECKQNVLDGIAFMQEAMSEDQLPDVLKGDYEIAYKYDVESLLRYYKGILSNAALERLTGINQKQMHHYASGLRRPSPRTAKKIEASLHDLGRELLSVRIA